MTEDNKTHHLNVLKLTNFLGRQYRFSLAAEEVFYAPVFNILNPSLKMATGLASFCDTAYIIRPQ